MTINYIPSVIHITESIPITSLNIDSLLLEKIKENIGDKCHKEGFIRRDSISIIERSIGKVDSSHFNGTIIYDCKVGVDICNPLENDIIDCIVKGKNKMGILAENSPLIIALTKFHHQDLNIFDEIKNGDSLKVKVIDSQYNYLDTNIQVIAKFISKN